jgi:hypothetical protein
MESAQDEIDEHRDIMESTGFDIVGPSVLVPEGDDYPGSYQVWTPIDGGNWVYVNPKGEVIRQACPL